MRCLAALFETNDNMEKNKIVSTHYEETSVLIVDLWLTQFIDIEIPK